MELKVVSYGPKPNGLIGVVFDDGLGMFPVLYKSDGTVDFYFDYDGGAAPECPQWILDEFKEQDQSTIAIEGDEL